MTHPPHKCRLLTFAPNMAVSRHPLGAIWAAHLLAPNKKPRRYCGKIITNTAVPPSTYKTPLAARPCVPPVHWAGYCPATIRCPNRATIKNHSARRLRHVVLKFLSEPSSMLHLALIVAETREAPDQPR